MEYAATTIFDGLGTFFSDLWGGIKRVAEDAWNGVSTVLSDTWGGIKKVASDIWGGITDFVGAAVNKAKEFLGLNSGNQLQVSTFDTSGALDYNSISDMRNTAFSTASSGFTALGEMMMQNLIKGLTSFLSDLFDVGAQAAKYFGNGLSSMEYSGNMMAVKSMRAIPALASGGMVSAGQVFIARESGPELVANIGNRTAVANNDQIIAGIEEAAYRGFSRANSENNEQESLLRELIDAVREGKTISIDGRELTEIAKERNERNGFDFRMVPV